MIVLDASVLIGYLDAEDAQHQAAETLLAREIDDDFAVSVLTLAEVLVGPARAGRLDDALSVLRALEVNERRFPDDAAIRLARLRADTGLRMPDCCVLMAAQEAGVRLATFDVRLAGAARSLDLVALQS